MKRNRNGKVVKPVTGLSVSVDDNFEKAFRIFNRKVNDSGKLREVRDRCHYVSDSEKRVKSMKMAKKRWQKKLSTMDIRSQSNRRR
jgi:ribosomal protein S21